MMLQKQLVRTACAVKPSLQLRGSGQVLLPVSARRHRQRCRPVAFKEDDKEQELLRRRQEEVRRKQEEDIELNERQKALDQIQGGLQGRGPQQPGPSKDIKEVTRDAIKEGVPSSLKDLGKLADKVQPTYSPSTPRVSLLVPAFTRRREIFVGRIAMLGFAGVCAMEILTPGHPGIINQVRAYTGWSPSFVLTVFAAIASYNLLASIAPGSPTWSIENIQDIARRPPGPPTVWVNPITNLRQFFGISEWGFTKRNELFHGRLAMLGFAAAIYKEIQTGGLGPLAQIANYLGIAADDNFYGLVTIDFLLFTTFAVILAYLNGNTGKIQGEEEIY